MSDTQVAIPLTLHEFDLGLGRSILREKGAMGVEVPERVIESASKDALITSARNWRQFYDASLSKLADMARYAEDEGEDAHEFFSGALAENINGVKAFLDEASSSYLARFVEAGVALKDDNFWKFLNLLQQLAG